MKMKYLIIYLLLGGFNTLFAQSIFWDDTEKKTWPAIFKEVEITSTLDGAKQKAYFYKSQVNQAQPLVVSLHTWSGNYQQKDPLIGQVLTYGWNYIHPDFRGANNTPDACGSEKVIQDIDDAIEYALQNANVNTSEIHVIGASGGGMATLLAYMNSKHPIKSFSAWVPISDLEKWYYETESRNLKYAQHIMLATQSEAHQLNVPAARKRSSFYMDLPKTLRENSKLQIFAGIHDGYKGSVPITQSIHFYNKLVDDWGLDKKNKVSEKDIITLLAQRSFHQTEEKHIAGRKIHYQKTNEKVDLTIFEGKHEMLTAASFQHIQPLHIVTIGDSNGAAKNGWVTQLDLLRQKDKISNFSISGNTIGFDNLGNTKLNALKNIESQLKEAEQVKPIDWVVVMLGTNDCKQVFNQQQKEVSSNMQKLIRAIKNFNYKHQRPKILLVAPPPYGSDEQLIEKYRGAGNRLDKLVPSFQRIAQREKINFVDLHSNLASLLLPHSKDGVHFDTPAYRIMALQIVASIKNNP